ncbi:helix-turn-helix domain-containing protein [Sunxiuqinia indica]|uniref:hypothetical protein n=1 Tax=Sunxiuqinia indica TaxID=2692584 RepID=UPI00135BA71F|nr:hypothetical protein [Sunxiuqinia indica]
MLENVRDLKAIRKQLPHGAIVQIAERAGVLAPTVSRALMGDTRSPKLPEIIKATAEVLKEFKHKEREAFDELNQVLNEETQDELTARLNHQQEKYGEGSSPLL